MKLPQADIRIVHFDRNVYEPAEDSFLLVDALHSEWPNLKKNSPSICLEIGSGTGYVICTAAMLLQGMGQCFATDINPIAADATQSTLNVHGVEGEVLVGDLLCGLEQRLAGKVDIMLFNPPYVLTPDEEYTAADVVNGEYQALIPDKDLLSSLARREDASATVRRLAAPVLKLRGLVLLHDNDPTEVSEILKGTGLDSTIIMTRAADEEKLHVLKVWRQSEPEAATPPPSKLPKPDMQVLGFDRSLYQRVYEPAEDTYMLVDALHASWGSLQKNLPSVCLEIGCGSGFVICTAALLMQGRGQCFATDISPTAAETTKRTLRAHGVDAEVLIGDLLCGMDVRLSGNVDILLFNPPYVPTSTEEVGCSGIERSWAGGKRGREVIDRVLPVVHKLLSGHGIFLMVLVDENVPTEISAMLRCNGLDSSIEISRTADEESLHVIKVWRQKLS